MELYGLAVADATEAITLDPSYVKVRGEEEDQQNDVTSLYSDLGATSPPFFKTGLL